MYSEDQYASHIVDHSGLIIYSALFVLTIGAAILKLVFQDAGEYRHAD
jgi:hypothetical protein